MEICLFSRARQPLSYLGRAEVESYRGIVGVARIRRGDGAPVEAKADWNNRRSVFGDPTWKWRRVGNEIVLTWSLTPRLDPFRSSDPCIREASTELKFLATAASSTEGRDTAQRFRNSLEIVVVCPSRLPALFISPFIDSIRTLDRRCLESEDFESLLVRINEIVEGRKLLLLFRDWDWTIDRRRAFSGT